ncbi:MAG: hypothetical protein AAF492_24410 [Verrucomicrobiota bacterium]
MEKHEGDGRMERCIACPKTFDRDEMICIDDQWICGTCKPTVVQMLQEGASLADMIVARQKRKLVMGKKAALPERCVKCNAPAEGQPLKRNLYWHSPFVYLCLLMKMLVYILVVGMVFGIVTTQVVTARRIDKEYIWLNGAGKDYLDVLPEWVEP